MDDRILEKLVKRDKARRKAREVEIDESLRSVMSVAKGRRLIYWLLSIGKLGVNPFTGNALQTSFNCGELNVAQTLQARVIALAPNFYLEMLKEMEDERSGDSADYERTSSGRNEGGEQGFGDSEAGIES
jgi:hypothetical protein